MRLITFRDPAGAERVGELNADRVAELAAPAMLAWLAGDGREPTGEEHALADVELLAPVPVPPSVRDFFAYEGHVAAGWRRRGGEIPAAWYDAPAFYFSNPASIRGFGEPVARPAATRMLDLELEIAAVIGADARIAGFTLLNDWSARDVQAREMAVGLGPHKGKDFALSLGPWLATPDELPWRDGRLDLEATLSINGHEVSRCRAGEMHWSWDELLAHAARDTRLRPGDVIGSGTLNGGCLLELGPLDVERFGPSADGSNAPRFLEPGDVVALAADGLGELATPIA